MSHAMKQIAAKNVGFKIELMKWSNRMDLLAISNDKGEVIVQRLNWQKIWTHPPPNEGVKVRGIDWRPGEKIIAAGYSTGLVVLLDIENQTEIHSIQLDGDIECFGWTQNTEEVKDDGLYDFELENPLNNHEIYLPPLPSFNSLSSTARKTDYTSMTKSYAQKVLNVLMVGLKTGIIHLTVFGVLPCGQIDIGKHLNLRPEDFQIVDAKMSGDFKHIFAFVKLQSSLQLLIFENEKFPKYSLPLLNVAIKHGYILNTMAYIDEIIQSVIEAWETVLLEMDNKLSKYASSQPPGSVSADFLELLMNGMPSEALEIFLTRDLTEKGLKKLGNSIEISYSTIQKLVIKPLHSGILNICYHLNNIKGMSRNTYYYKPILGDLSNEAKKNAGSFLIKSLELQQTIEQSTRDYKIFWCWLYGIIIRLMDETVPDDIAAVSQQDIIYLAEFLNNFDRFSEKDEEMASSTFNNETNVSTTTSSQRKKFNLERVGQYLEDQNLQTELRIDLTQKWIQLLDNNECLKECDLIYPHDKQFSLVQQHNKLKDSLKELFLRPERLIGSEFALKTAINCVNNLGIDSIISTSYVNVETASRVNLIALIDNTTMCFIEIDQTNGELEFIKASQLEFGPKPENDEKFTAFGDILFRNVQFYNEEMLSMLLYNRIENRSFNCFVQFPFQQIQSQLQKIQLHSNASDKVDLTTKIGTKNFFDIIDPQLIRTIEGSDGYIISVSGSRKVISLLSESQKRIRLYEMEVEEDEEDLLDKDTSSQNACSLDVSKESCQSN